MRWNGACVSDERARVVVSTLLSLFMFLSPFLCVYLYKAVACCGPCMPVFVYGFNSVIETLCCLSLRNCCHNVIIECELTRTENRHEQHQQQNAEKMRAISFREYPDAKWLAWVACLMRDLLCLSRHTNSAEIRLARFHSVHDSIPQSILQWEPFKHRNHNNIF